jgi:hypothetical protein
MEDIRRFALEELCIEGNEAGAASIKLPLFI